MSHARGVICSLMAGAPGCGSRRRGGSPGPCHAGSRPLDLAITRDGVSLDGVQIGLLTAGERISLRPQAEAA